MQKSFTDLSIRSRNDSYTYGESNQTLPRLIPKTNVNRYKSVTVPTQTIIHPSIKTIKNVGFMKRISHIMPGALIRAWTRSPVIGNRTLKVYDRPKGADFFAHNMSTNTHGSLEDISKRLNDLKKTSIKNNIAGVNKIVISLLENPKFWILCYHEIKSNPCVRSPEDYLQTDYLKTLDEIDKNFFTKLAKRICNGNFRFSHIKRVEMPKPK
jgi:hypothetical protein